jgi:hypothetical protein
MTEAVSGPFGLLPPVTCGKSIVGVPLKRGCR